MTSSNSNKMEECNCNPSPIPVEKGRWRNSLALWLAWFPSQSQPHQWSSSDVDFNFAQSSFRASLHRRLVQGERQFPTAKDGMKEIRQGHLKFIKMTWAMDGNEWVSREQLRAHDNINNTQFISKLFHIGSKCQSSSVNVSELKWGSCTI